MSAAEKLKAMREAKAAATKAEGIAFLAANSKKESITELGSGLQYEILTEGTGPKPPSNKCTVTCHYHGTLLNGKVFDSSVQRNRVAVFPLNKVIAGWQEALQLMPTGSKWRLFLPHYLGYGDQQVGTDIAPYSTLIFEVELISFV